MFPSEENKIEITNDMNNEGFYTDMVSSQSKNESNNSYFQFEQQTNLVNGFRP